MEHLHRTTKTERNGWRSSYRCDCGSEFEALEYNVKIPGIGWGLDRIDNDGNYCKDNCQWLTVSENSSKRWKDRADEQQP